MGQQPTGEPTPLTKQIHAEIRGLMAQRHISARQLADAIGISESRISRTVTHSKLSITVNEWGRICEALGTTIEHMARAAERSLQEQQAYDLAAKTRKARNHDVDEADYL